MFQEEDLLSIDKRAAIISEIISPENTDRKSKSLRSSELYSGEIKPYIIHRFRERGYSLDTINEIPIQSTINICKKVVDSQANIYQGDTKREFANLSEDQAETIYKVYEDMDVDTKLMNSNRFFKLQNQNHVLITPKNGKLCLKPLKLHQIDVIPHPDEPERALAYILSSYDKQLSQLRDIAGDGGNQDIADLNDYLLTKARFTFWSENYHFTVDGHGAQVSEDIVNPIAPLIPIIEVSEEKDFEYFVRSESPSVDFTVDFGEQVSSNSLVVSMQGFAQAYYKAPEELQPSHVTIGTTKMLRIITDPNGEADIDFGFANTGADLAGIQSHLESVLSMFLSSMGLDASTVTASGDSKTYSSGVERLLAMINDFEASRSDMAQYKYLEEQLAVIVSAWLNTLRESDQLNSKYKTSELPEDMGLSLSFFTPEMIQTDREKLETIEKRIELGLLDRRMAVMEYYDLEPEEAEKFIDKMENDIDGIFKAADNKEEE